MALKKRHPKFNVPNYGAKSRKGVKKRWRKQRGIDNKKRVKKSFMGAEPTIGYRNPETMRHTRSSGKHIAIIRNAREMDSFAEKGMQVAHDAVIAHAVSKRTRRIILEAAKRRGITVVNPGTLDASDKEAKNGEKPVKAPDAARDGQNEQKTQSSGKEGAVNEH